MAGKTAILSVSILADAKDATRGLDQAADAADDFGRRTADAMDTVGDRSGDTATGLSALSGAMDAAGFSGVATAMDLTATAMDAAEGSTILFKVAQESLNLSTLKATGTRIANTAATISGTVATWLANTATTAWTAAQWLLNAAFLASPIGWIVLGIIALVAAIVLAWKKSETFRDVVIKAWDAIKNAAAAVWDWIVKKVQWVFDLLLKGVKIWIGLYVKAFEVIKTGVGAVWEWLKNTAKNTLEMLQKPIDAIKGAFEAVGDAISGVIDWIKKLKLPDWFTDFAGKIGGILGLSAATTGTRAATTGGPLLRGASTRAASSSGGVTINVNGALDPVGVARQIRQILRNDDRRRGGIVIGAVPA